jgi:hypothetical protein
MQLLLLKSRKQKLKLRLKHLLRIQITLKIRLEISDVRHEMFRGEDPVYSGSFFALNLLIVY